MSIYLENIRIIEEKEGALAELLRAKPATFDFGETTCRAFSVPKLLWYLNSNNIVLADSARRALSHLKDYWEN